MRASWPEPLGSLRVCSSASFLHGPSAPLGLMKSPSQSRKEGELSRLACCCLRLLPASSALSCFPLGQTAAWGSAAGSL